MGIKNIWIIAPHPELAETVEKFVDDFEVKFDIRVGNMEEGLFLAKEAIRHGAEVIISRGGTAELIRRKLDIPVVEICTTGFDLLKVFYPFRDFTGKIAVIGFKNVIAGCISIGETLGLNIEEFRLKSNSEVPGKIKEASRNGFTLIVGDTEVVAEAKKAGFESRLICSGKEAIADAVDEAQRLVEVREQERAVSSRLKTIVDNVREGIISIDANGIINVFNTTAEKIIQIPHYKVLGKKISSILKGLNFKKDKCTHQVLKINNADIICNVFPVNVDGSYSGSVITFQEVNKIRNLEQTIRQEMHEKGLVATKKMEDIVGNSNDIKIAIKKATKFSEVDSTVLIIGESGTGKEIFAQGIHNLSWRKQGPFVAVNCAALPESLLESELFGYEKGAFTGALSKGKMGLFELAHGGTIFLDEIGEMPMNLQARLLRVIQEKQVMRLGGQTVIPVDVRIISATNRDLKTLVEKKKFREDLYYRLNVLTLYLPPLRKRKEDIPDLVRYFVNKTTEKYNRNPIKLSDAAIQELINLPWKGNIRELENVIERLVLLYDGLKVEVEDIKKILGDSSQFMTETEQGFEVKGICSLEELESAYIKHVLQQEKSKVKIAEKLGINRVTLWRKMQQYNLVNRK